MKKVDEVVAAAEANDVTEKKPKSSGAPKKIYTKQQFIASESYKIHKDLLNALLEDDVSYTKAEVQKLLNDYLKKEVK